MVRTPGLKAEPRVDPGVVSKHCLIVDLNPDLFQTRTPVYTTHCPAGTSVQNMVHWAQVTQPHEHILNTKLSPAPIVYLQNSYQLLDLKTPEQMKSFVLLKQSSVFKYCSPKRNLQTHLLIGLLLFTVFMLLFDVVYWFYYWLLSTCLVLFTGFLFNGLLWFSSLLSLTGLWLFTVFMLFDVYWFYYWLLLTGLLLFIGFLYNVFFVVY